jgi:hypothetical protein
VATIEAIATAYEHREISPELVLVSPALREAAIAALPLVVADSFLRPRPATAPGVPPVAGETVAASTGPHPLWIVLSGLVLRLVGPFAVALLLTLALTAIADATR